jgi:hypothetical protein
MVFCHLRHASPYRRFIRGKIVQMAVAINTFGRRLTCTGIPVLPSDGNKHADTPAVKNTEICGSLGLV